MCAWVRGRRITREDLVQESGAVLASAGVGNHCRAVYLSAIGREVLASPDPAFFQFQPQVLRRALPAWVRAYAVAFLYLSDHGLARTAATAAIENRAPAPAFDRESASSTDQLSGLIGGAPPKASVRQRIDSALTPRRAGERGRTPAKRATATPTPTQRGVKNGALFIASPRNPRPKDGLTGLSESDEQSDFVIEEIRPRETKRK
jgi:hypothetical protein